MRIVVFLTVVIGAIMALLAFDVMLMSDTKTHVFHVRISSGEAPAPGQPVPSN